MKRQKESSIAQAGGAPVAGPTEAAEPVYQQIKLALDVHAGDLMVVRMVIGGAGLGWVRPVSFVRKLSQDPLSTKPRCVSELRVDSIFRNK